MLTISVAPDRDNARRQRRGLRDADRERLAVAERSRLARLAADPLGPRSGRCRRSSGRPRRPAAIATAPRSRRRTSPPTITIGIVPTMISRPSRSYSPSRPLSAPGAAAISFTTSARKNATTASSVPTWHATSNAIPNRPGSQPKNARARIRWPELDTGRNSVSPCTTPSSAAEIRSTSGQAPRRCYDALRVPCGRPLACRLPRMIAIAAAMKIVE